MKRLLTAIGLTAALAGAGPAAADVVATADEGLTLVSDDGAARELVTRGGEDAAWSPDGTRLVFGRYRRDAYRLFSGPAAGPFTEVAGSAGLVDAAWSPDGATLAATRIGSSGPPDIVVLPAAGGTPRAVTSGRDGTPAWAPDGSEIAFTRQPASPLGDPAVMAVRPDGSGLRNLSADGIEPAWSPDGKLVAFASTRDDNGLSCPEDSDDCATNHELYVVGADGAGERRLTDSPADDRHPAWSPDGTRIAFASDRHYIRGQLPELFVMDADGGCVTQLTIGSDSVAEPAWRAATSPVGRGACGVRLAAFHDTVDLGRVRVRDAQPLFPGSPFSGMRPVAANGRRVFYDECDLVDPAGCAGEIMLATFTTCERNPARLPVAVTRVERLKGALVLRYGPRVELISGGTTTVIEADLPARGFMPRLLRALRPIGRSAAARRLAAPQLPARAWGRLLASPRFRRDGVEHKAALVRSDRRVVRGLARLDAGRRPACARGQSSG